MQVWCNFNLNLPLKDCKLRHKLFVSFYIFWYTWYGWCGLDKLHLQPLKCIVETVCHKWWPTLWASRHWWGCNQCSLCVVNSMSAARLKFILLVKTLWKPTVAFFLSSYEQWEKHGEKLQTWCLHVFLFLNATLIECLRTIRAACSSCCT